MSFYVAPIAYIFRILGILNSSIFSFWDFSSFIPLLVVRRIRLIRIIIIIIAMTAIITLTHPPPLLHPRPRPRPCAPERLLDSLYSLQRIDQNQWSETRDFSQQLIILFTTRRHEIKLEYFRKPFSRYCYCKSTFET